MYLEFLENTSDFTEILLNISNFGVITVRHGFYVHVASGFRVSMLHVYVTSMSVFWEQLKLQCVWVWWCHQVRVEMHMQGLGLFVDIVGYLVKLWKWLLYCRLEFLMT